jgi:hypothetical protein
MKLFPFSLRDKASYWFKTIGKPIGTWPELRREFLQKFFPIGRTNAMRRAITTFSQGAGEKLHESWDRFHDLLRKCPHHGIPRWHLAQIFYHGLDDTHRYLADASSGGNFLAKDENSAFELFESLAENSMNAASMNQFQRPGQQRVGVHEAHTDSIRADMDIIIKQLDRMNLIEKKIDQISQGQSDLSSVTARSSYAPRAPPARVNLLTRDAPSPYLRDPAYQDPINNPDLTPYN